MSCATCHAKHITYLFNEIKNTSNDKFKFNALSSIPESLQQIICGISYVTFRGKLLMDINCFRRAERTHNEQSFGSKVQVQHDLNPFFLRKYQKASIQTCCFQFQSKIFFT